MEFAIHCIVRCLKVNNNFTCGNPFNNNLINQVITTELNVRYNAMMNSDGLDYGNFQIAAACIDQPSFVANDLPTNATINDLLNYANDFLACQCENTCSDFDPVMAELTSIFLGLNSRFEECYVPEPCYLANEGGETIETNFGLTFENKNDRIGVSLFPNPTDGVINLTSKDWIGASFRIDILNIHGQVMSTFDFQDNVESNIQLDLSSFSEGVYYMKASISYKEVVVKKFILLKN